jgi:hypothetical protein
MKAKVEGVHQRAVLINGIQELESHPAVSDERGEVG